MIEPLESRTLFSHALPSVVAAPHGRSAPTASAYDAVLTSSTGPTFNAVAGVPVTAQLGFVQSPLVNGLNVTASIQWGDGTAASSVPVVATELTAQGYPIVATHTYAQPGRYTIEAEVIGAPVAVPGQPTPQFIAILADITATAVVTAAPSEPTPPTQPIAPATPVTATAGQTFTTTLGSVSSSVPAARLRASVQWGDGKTSTGQLTAMSTTDVGSVNYSVAATHRYKRPGVFSVRVVVHQRGMTGKLSLAGAIDSTANVSAAAS